MYLTTPQALIIVLCVTLGMIVCRFTPFILFSDNTRRPPVVDYLGRALPAAMMGLLVVYCLRNTPVTQPPHGIPELIAIAVTALLHLWRKNVLLSIFAGTAVYMLLVQKVFI